MGALRGSHRYVEIIYVAGDGDFFRATPEELAAKTSQFEDPASGRTYGAHELDCTRPLTDEETAAYIQACKAHWGRAAAGEFSPKIGARHYD